MDSGQMHKTSVSSHVGSVMKCAHISLFGTRTDLIINATIRSSRRPHYMACLVLSRFKGNSHVAPNCYHALAYRHPTNREGQCLMASASKRRKL